MLKMDFVPGYVHFGVVQERDYDHVGSEYEDGHHIVNEYINPTCHLRPQVQQVQHRSHWNKSTHAAKQVPLECLVFEIEVIDLK